MAECKAVLPADYDFAFYCELVAGHIGAHVMALEVHAGPRGQITLEDRKQHVTGTVQVTWEYEPNPSAQRVDTRRVRAHPGGG